MQSTADVDYLEGSPYGGAVRLFQYYVGHAVVLNGRVVGGHEAFQLDTLWLDYGRVRWQLFGPGAVGHTTGVEGDLDFEAVVC